MDFHALPRRDLQVLAKRNGIRANMTNGAMADALAALPAVDGVEEYVQHTAAERTPADEPVVQATAEEEEEKEAPSEEEQESEKQHTSLPVRRGVALTPQEVIVLDDSEEEEEKDPMPDHDEDKAPAGRRRATRRAQVEPVVAPATRKRAVASKAETGDEAAEPVPARATRGRSQRAVGSVAEEEAPKTRRTSRKAVAKKTSTEKEEDEKATQGDVSDVEAAVDAQNEEQNAPVEEQSQEDEGQTEKEDVAAEAVPARATRARSQRTVVSAAEEQAPKARRMSRRTVARKTGTEQEEEEKTTHGDFSDMEVDVPAPVCSSEGADADGGEEMEEAIYAQNKEQNESVEEQSQEDEGETGKGDVAEEAVPARATRGRRQRTVVSVAEEEAPKARRTSRRAAASKTCDVSDVEAAVPEASSDEGSDGAEVTIVAQNEEQKQSQEDQGEAEKVVAAAEAVEAAPARATRGRRQRTVAEEEVPKARRTSRRAAASKTCDVSDVEAAMPAPASSDKGSDDAQVAIDAQNEEQKQSQEDEGESEKVVAAAEAVEAMPARATRARRQRAVVSPAEEEAPKTRRTSRRATARKTNTEQEEGEKATQGDVSDMEAAVHASVSSDEGADGAEEMEAAMNVQNEEQLAAAEVVPARATRARSQRTVMSVSEDDAPKAKRTSRRAVARKTSTREKEEEQKGAQADVTDVEAAVPVPVSSDNQGDGAEETEAAMEASAPVPVSSDSEGDGAEEIEAAMDAQNVEQERTELVEEQCHKNEVQTGVGADVPTLLQDQEPAVPEDCQVDSSVEEQTDTVSSEEIQHSSEDMEMVPVEEVPQATPKSGELTEEVDLTSDDSHASELDEDCTVEEESAVAEDADSSVQELLVDVQRWEATEEVDCTSDAGEEDEDCMVEEEQQVADEVDSSVQEPSVHVEDCEATKEIHTASEDTEMVPLLESGDATEDADFTGDVGYATKEIEPPIYGEMLQSAAKAIEQNEVPTSGEEDMAADMVTDNTDVSGEDMAGHASEVNEEDCTVEEEPVPEDVQQCKATEEIYLASEDAVMLPVNEEPQDTLTSGDAEDVHFTDDASEENESPTSEVVLQSADNVTEKNEDMAADEEPHNTDEYAQEEAVAAMPQRSEEMDEGGVEEVTVESLSQATVTDDETVAKETGDLTDVSVEEKEAVTADEMPLCSATMDESFKEEVLTVDDLSQATVTDDNGAADGMPHSPATMEENVEEVVTMDNLLQATVTEDEGAVKESGFTGELMDDVPVEEDMAADEIPHSSATMDEDVEEELVTVDNLSQATVTEEEGPVKESVFNCGLSVLSVDEETVMAAGSSATMNKSVEVVVTVDNPSQATVTDEEWAVKESSFTGDCTPVVDTARDFSDHTASPLSANVFEDAAKSLSMDSIAVKPMISEPADVPLCMFSSSAGEKNATEPVAVQQENEPEAAFGKIMHSPLSIRKLRMAVAQEIEADSVPRCLTIRKPRTNLSEKVAVAQENEVMKEGEKSSVPLDSVAVQPEDEVKEPEAEFGRVMHSPLSIRKLRMAVTQEIEADSVPRCLTIRKPRTNLSEKVAVAQENEVMKEGEKSAVPLDSVPVQRRDEVKEGYKSEAAFDRIMRSPLSIRKLRTAVAQEIEADSVPRCLTIRKLRTNLSEKVAVAQENEVKEGEKSSAPLDKLSLRKLRMKLRETLNAQKNTEPKRVPLGRLDENAC